MKKNTVLCILNLFFALSISISVSAQNRSAYSTLDARKCRVVAFDNASESGSWRCNGVAGYKLIAIDNHLRGSVTVIAPSRQEYPLNFSHIFPSFSSIGERAEWRMKRINGAQKPVALIVRYNVSDPEEAARSTSYLMVSKITNNETCVVGFVPPSSTQNAKAREMADRAAAMNCYETAE